MINQKEKESRRKTEELQLILKHNLVYPVYQPILSLKDASVYGYEALTRIRMESCTLNPEELFNLAKKENCLWELEALTRKNALKHFGRGQPNAKLFLNVDPDVIHDRKFKHGFTAKYIEKYGLDASNIVFEVTERTMIKHEQSFKQVIRHYKKQNYKIAVDDFGSEYAGMRRLYILMPHFIKIDMQLVRNIDKDPVKQSLVKSISVFGKDSGISLIAEGIETKEELAAIVDLGIEYGQGYYLARPSKELWDDRLPLKRELEQFHNKHADSLKTRNLLQFISSHSDQDRLILSDESGCYVDRITVADIRQIAERGVAL